MPESVQGEDTMPDRTPEPQDTRAASPGPANSASAPMPNQPVPIGEELDDLEKEDRFRTFQVVGIVLAAIAAVVAVISFATVQSRKAAGLWMKLFRRSAG